MSTTRIAFLGISVPGSKPPCKGAFPLIVTKTDTWSRITDRLQLHKRDRPDWPILVQKLSQAHDHDYNPWPTLDMMGEPLGVAWFAFHQEADEPPRLNGFWHPSFTTLDPEFEGQLAMA